MLHINMRKRGLKALEMLNIQNIKMGESPTLIGMSRGLLILLFLLCIFWGCIGGGTHGYIKAYDYTTSKYELEKAVQQVISESTVVYQDSIKDYYNDDTSYIRISIIEYDLTYTYIFRFYGGKDYWKASKTSEIFIAYAHDEKFHGGSSGNGGIKWYDFKLKKRLIEPFEREFIEKIDRELKIKHTEE